MAYMGRKGASAPITSADIPDDSITSAKIVADAVGSSDLAPDIALTGGSVGIPSVTTANRPGESGGTNASQTATVGMIIYNSTIGMLQQYNATGWASIDSPPTVSSLNYPGDDTALDTVGEYNDATCDYNNDPTIAHDANSNMKVGMSVSGTGIPVGATIASVTSTTAFELSASTTGGAVTNGTLTFNTQTLIITGTNFEVGATVTVDGTAPSTVTRDSITQITITGTPAKTTGTKTNGLVITNPSGLAGSIDVDYSALPDWQTASGNVLSTFEGITISTIDLDATTATSYALTSGALPGGLAMSTSTGDITGTISSATATFNFTVTATDAEAQSSPRLFNIINSGAAPTGGTITTYSIDGTAYRIHTFLLAQTGDDFINASALTIDYLIVAGGGGGGTGRDYWGGAGGGGAGGLLTATDYSLAAGTYEITVGDGGAGGVENDQDDTGDVGNNSGFGGAVANGGGFGGGGGGNQDGGNGGSGGGTGYSPGRTAGTGTAGPPRQGYDGGLAGTNNDGGGGGGGHGAVGGVGGTEIGGVGGAGTANSYRLGTGVSAVTYAVGGAGGHFYDASSGANGADDYGNGGEGGGGGYIPVSGDSAGGDGGSGIVVIRYAV